jgi:hypothetical protein
MILFCLASVIFNGQVLLRNFSTDLCLRMPWHFAGRLEAHGPGTRQQPGKRWDRPQRVLLVCGVGHFGRACPEERRVLSVLQGAVLRYCNTKTDHALASSSLGISTLVDTDDQIYCLATYNNFQKSDCSRYTYRFSWLSGTLFPESTNLFFSSEN